MKKGSLSCQKGSANILALERIAHSAGIYPGWQSDMHKQVISSKLSKLLKMHLAQHPRRKCICPNFIACVVIFYGQKRKIWNQSSRIIVKQSLTRGSLMLFLRSYARSRAWDGCYSPRGVWTKRTRCSPQSMQSSLKASERAI